MICKICGKEFEPKQSNMAQQKYCSNECRVIVRKEHEKMQNEKNKAKIAARDRTKRCPICNQDFWAVKNEKYCSEECRHKASRMRRYTTLLEPEKPKKKLKGLDGLEKQLKKKGDFIDEYAKWKREQALSRVTPINLNL